MFVVLVILAAAVLVWWASRKNELFCVSVRGERVLVVRGRIPGGLLSEFREALRNRPPARATIRAVRGPGGCQLVFGGDLDEGRQQRLRNCFALYPASQLRAAPPIENASLGQLLGIVWLAWLLDRSVHR
jgi:hypothetical protein